jgi:transcriptional regulator with XRE-family HTH domain
MSTTAEFPTPSSTRVQFADEVRVLMTRRRINQTQMAKDLGIGQSEVSKRLRGVVPFRFDEIVFLADYFGVSVGSLFGETTDRGPRPGGPDEGLRYAIRDSNPEPADMVHLGSDLRLVA